MQYAWKYTWRHKEQYDSLVVFSQNTQTQIWDYFVLIYHMQLETTRKIAVILQRGMLSQIFNFRYVWSEKKWFVGKNDCLEECNDRVK